MRTEFLMWADGQWNTDPQLKNPTFVLYFGGQGVLDSGERYRDLRSFYPKAHLLGGSTGGEIYQAAVQDHTVVAVAVELARTSIRTAKATIATQADSHAIGKTLGSALAQPDLRYIFLLSDGMYVNGDALVSGIYETIDPSVIVTGGLAGDAADFKRTLVGLDAPPEEHQIAAIGFYGDALQVGYGCVGGWQPFGPSRRVTKSAGTILYELDGKPALDLYKLYLGDEAANLPSSALMFPLSIRPDATSEHNEVRTVIGVNEEEKSITFAGDMPQGCIAQLMRGDFGELVDGATLAATLANRETSADSLAILVSCIGRKLLMGQSISDETEGVAEVFNHRIPTIGFYSYGEICHQQFTGKCGLHNQTMTVTVLHEA